MWLMRTRLTWPAPAHDRTFPSARIGRLLGHRDHSTVLHGVGVSAARLSTGRPEDAYLRHTVNALTTALDAAYETERWPHQRAA